jgi:hypothetical protein
VLHYKQPVKHTTGRRPPAIMNEVTPRFSQQKMQNTAFRQKKGMQQSERSHNKCYVFCTFWGPLILGFPGAAGSVGASRRDANMTGKREIKQRQIRKERKRNTENWRTEKYDKQGRDIQEIDGVSTGLQSLLHKFVPTASSVYISHSTACVYTSLSLSHSTACSDTWRSCLLSFNYSPSTLPTQQVSKFQKLEKLKHRMLQHCSLWQTGLSDFFWRYPHRVSLFNCTHLFTNFRQHFFIHTHTNIHKHTNLLLFNSRSAQNISYHKAIEEDVGTTSDLSP